MNNTGLQPAVYPRYAFPVLLGTIVLGFTSGKVISWCEKRWARGARALEAKLLDEESSGSYSVQPQKEHHQRQRSQSRRRPPTASTVNDKLWEAGLPDPRRVSDSQWKIINGIPAPSLQPPIRIASESERGRQHHEPVTIVYPARVKTPSRHRRTRSASQTRATESRIERSRDRRLADRQERYCWIEEGRRSNYAQGRNYGQGSF